MLEAIRQYLSEKGYTTSVLCEGYTYAWFYINVPMNKIWLKIKITIDTIAIIVSWTVTSWPQIHAGESPLSASSHRIELADPTSITKLEQRLEQIIKECAKS